MRLNRWGAAAGWLNHGSWFLFNLCANWRIYVQNPVLGNLCAKPLDGGPL
jgi:hypothetical protein